MGRFLSRVQTQHYIHAFSRDVRDRVDGYHDTRQRALRSCADVMISQLSFTINKLNKANHLSIAYSSTVYFMSIRGSLCRQEVVYNLDVQKYKYILLALGAFRTGLVDIAVNGKQYPPSGEK